MNRPKVLITGVTGLIGGLAVRHLSGKYEFSGLSRQPCPGIPHTAADITDAEAIKPAFVGIPTVLHLAAATGPVQTQDWGATMAITAQGTLNVYEAARLGGVKRVVFFSTGAVQIGWEGDPRYPFKVVSMGPDSEAPATWPKVSPDWAERPGNPYAVGKLFGEHVARFFADKHGISSIVIRCGAVSKDNRPEDRRHQPGYFSHSDCLQLIDKALSAPPSLLYGIFYGISENKWRWRDTDSTKKVLGWKPTGNADRPELPM